MSKSGLVNREKQGLDERKLFCLFQAIIWKLRRCEQKNVRKL